MDGVTILEEMSYRGYPLELAMTFTIILVIVVVRLIYLFVDWYGTPGPLFAKSFLIISIVVTIVLCVIVMAIGFDAYNTVYTKYKVTIDGSVSFKEFTDRYEILSNDGAVYTVMEREYTNGDN